MQIGDHFISLRIKPNIKIFSCCSREKEEVPDFLEYQKYNQPLRFSFFGEIIKDSADDIAKSIRISSNINNKKSTQSINNNNSNLSKEMEERQENEFINVNSVCVQQSRFHGI